MSILEKRFLAYTLLADHLTLTLRVKWQLALLGPPFSPPQEGLVSAALVAYVIENGMLRCVPALLLQDSVCEALQASGVIGALSCRSETIVDRFFFLYSTPD